MQIYTLEINQRTKTGNTKEEGSNLTHDDEVRSGALGE